MTQLISPNRLLAVAAEGTFGSSSGITATDYMEFANYEPTYDKNVVEDRSQNQYRQTLATRSGNTLTGGTLDVEMRPTLYDRFFEAGLMGPAWSSNVLKIGTVLNAVRRSFAFESQYTDHPTAAEYEVQNGMMVNTITVNFPADNTYVNAQFGFVGKSTSAMTTTPLDASPTAVTSEAKYYHDGGVVSIGGVACEDLISASFTLDNQISPTYTYGSSDPYEIPWKRALVSGNVELAMSSKTEWERFKAGTRTSLSITATNGTKTHTFLFPNIIYVTGQMVTEGDNGITVSFEFRADYDNTEATALKITRT